MATSELIASADRASKPAAPAADVSWGTHILADAYANGAPERDESGPYRPVITWASNRWLAAWESPIHESGARQQWARECSVIAGVTAGER